ncbi:MAG: hypothetical protein ABS68_01195 [Niastella sp. SCN 39-18]|nr:hypothetical protein [Sphingobacteriales bacterium]ODT54426.1 MAG: hypothetical protein ABS68_01195 [Niastella sp. SCN 39-18]OJW10694.1 MAG: hypothetical protein BGO53_13965 [Sphingobacteriales bacterium 39-19]
MSTHKLLFLVLLIYPVCQCSAQADSAFALTEKLSQKYLTHTSNKIDLYSKRVSNKTEKTLVKLCRWETKIQTLLQKANPEAAERLFANNSISFKKLLEEYKRSESQLQSYKAGYDKYRDDLLTQLKYIDSNKTVLTKKSQELLTKAKDNASQLENEEARNEAFQKMIKERRQQLIAEAMKYMGKNKYLQKINKEGWYYVETLKNYKQLFNEPGKAEETAKNILSKIPAFKEFMRRNSMLASLLGISADAASSQSLAGLQTRFAANNQMQSLATAGGPNGAQYMQQNMQTAQAELNKLKQRIEKVGSSGSGELPDFKPNNQKTKTFAQRLEYSADIQPLRGNAWLPGALNTGINVGYKLNDKSVIGAGMSYKLGLGSIQKIRFSNQGIGFRSFIDWKLKKQFFISGGYELNKIPASPQPGFIIDEWQRSGLVGLSKKQTIGKKRTVKTQLLCDFLSYQQIPKTQPILFRVGISLK